MLAPLAAGRTARYRRWPAGAGHPVGWAEVTPGGCVIVEGVSALTRAVTARLGRWWDLSLWVAADEGTRRARIAARDGRLARWERDWWPSEAAYFAAERPDLVADFIVG
ncbi:hypothetical protein [Tessaracoccus sp. OH4464_COT-324]|uniref:hypothetical protein n=1 Tax=Tessaracoccus sp. OH4464_COT-324 TaxID=2491059 RepID=UPI000F635D4B|nr:hypothetical protein [Tessaracoccus sp. OH4464_COT-324]RRD45830.1 hypothetical protein EII42_09850 [Tessaracoccus sp. OH4464_COT-324]